MLDLIAALKIDPLSFEFRCSDAKDELLKLERTWNFYQNSLNWKWKMARIPKIFVKLSMSIYDFVLLDVCHFHHQFLLIDIQISVNLSRYSCLHLGSCIHHFITKKADLTKFLSNIVRVKSSNFHAVLQWVE